MLFRSPGREVRLRYAYFITCCDVVKDPQTGAVIELHCTYDPATRGGDAPDGRKVKSTIHWVAAKEAVNVEVRQYDRLFTVEDTAKIDEGKDYKEFLNLASLAIAGEVKAEPSLLDAVPGTVVQFERLGYFCVDRDSASGHKVFNRTVTLKDDWAKIEKRSSVSKR